MKFRVENIWRGTHFHHRQSAYGRTTDRWASVVAARTRRPAEPGKPHNRYSDAAANVLYDAVRRCPSVSIDDDIMEGQPCVEGTRIPVRSVLRAIELYGSIDGATKCYPHLSSQQVKDALYFAQIVLEQPSGIDESAVAAR